MFINTVIKSQINLQWVKVQYLLLGTIWSERETSPVKSSGQGDIMFLQLEGTKR